MKDRVKEIQHLLYLKSELLKQTRKEIKTLNTELRDIEGQKRLEKKKGNKKNGR